MGGRANKKRRKQARLKQRRQGQSSSTEVRRRSPCPLYFHQPDGQFYRSWVDCGGLQKTLRWADAVTQRAHGCNEAEVVDFARRMPYFAAIYGRQVPAEAAYCLDRYIDEGVLPVQWAEDDPVINISISDMAPPLTNGSVVEARLAIHDLHAMCCLIIDDDGTVIPLVPGKAIS